MYKSIYDYNIKIIHSDVLHTSRIVIYNEERTVLVFETSRDSKVRHIHIDKFGSDLWIKYQNILLDLIGPLFRGSKANNEEIDIKITPSLIGDLAAIKINAEIFDLNKPYNPNK